MAQMSPRTLSCALRLFAFFAAVLAVIALVFTPTPALAAGDVIDDSAVIVLTTDNFAQKTKSGTWIVEFYVPWCKHCKRFAPKYAKWAQKALQWRDSYNFHVAKVDCVAHKDVCEQNEVAGFPTIYAFVNGERKDEFEDEQTYKAIEKFGTAMVAKYPPAHAGSVPAHDRAAAGNTADVDAKPAKKQADEVTGTSSGGSMQLTAELKAKQAEFVKAMKERTIPDLGRYGRVVDLTTDNFEEVTSRGGPWLLEFYAPWCGHCQQLEGTYTQLAEKLKGKMNVARINADDQTELRQRFGIRGYPTLKLYKSGATTDYRGARTLEALEKFALSSVQPSDVRHVTYAEFARLRDEHEVAVVFAYGAKAKTSEWLAFLEAADSWMLPTVTGVYASVDPQFSASNAGEAVVLVYRRGYKQVSRYPTGQDAAASAGDADEDDEDKKKDANKIVYDEEAEAAKKAAAEAVKFSVAGVRKFVHDHRFPLLPELTDHNAEDIMDGTSDEDDESDAAQSRRRRIVVLGILDPKTTADDKERRVLTEVADKVLRESGGRMHGVTVQSVWLNGRVWQDYIQRVYQLSAADLPRVIISVPAHEEFFATGEDGEPIAFTTAAIYDAVEDVVKQKAGIAGHHAKLSSTSTRGRIVSWAKAGWRKVNTLSPGFLLGAVVVSVLGIWFMCCRGGSSAAAYDRLESSKFD